MISLIQFEDKDGHSLSEVLQVPTAINLEQLKGLISTEKNLYLNGNLISDTLEASLSKNDLNDCEKIYRIKLSDDEKMTQPAVYCSSSYSGHEGPVLRVRFCLRGADSDKKTDLCPTKLLLVTAGGDKTVRFWDMLTKTQFKTVSHHTHWVMHLESNDKYVFSAGMDSLINMYDFTGKFLKTISKQKKGISCLKLSKLKNGNTILASGARDGSVIIYEIQELEATPSKHSIKDNSSESSSDSASLSKIRISVLQKWTHSTAVTAINVNEESIISGSKDGTMKVYQINGTDIKYHGDIKGHTTQINAIETTGHFMISGEDSGQIIIWKHFQIRNRLVHKREVISISISPNGINFASGSFDKTVKVWNLDTGAILGTYFHVGFVYKVKFYSDLVISCSKDKTIRMYRVSQNKCISDLVVDDEVYDFDYSNGYLAAGLKNSKVYFFN